MYFTRPHRVLNTISTMLSILNAATLGGHAGFVTPGGTVQVTNPNAKSVAIHTDYLSGTEADRGFFLSLNC